MEETGLVEAELMVVKGDGSLVGAEFARLRPVETILSGPAASLSGAAHLVGRKDAIVADIGGTTTDIAILEGGFPQLSPKGATIGGWSTMVEAADIRTGGLGGDSEVRLIDRGTKGGVLLGPRRVIPLSMLATDEARLADWLEIHLQNPVATAQDGRFVVPLFDDEPPQWLTRSEANMARQCRDSGYLLSPISRRHALLSRQSIVLSPGVCWQFRRSPPPMQLLFSVSLMAVTVPLQLKGGELDGPPAHRCRCRAGHVT